MNCVNAGMQNKLFKTYLAFNGISTGIFVLILYVLTRRLIEMLPLPLIQYCYLLPVTYILIHVFRIPRQFDPIPGWIGIVDRIQLLSVVTALLSPFWTWWTNCPSNPYLTVNMLFMCLFFLAFLATLGSAVSLLAIQLDLPLLKISAKLGRIGIIYVSISTVLAFILAMSFGIYDGEIILRIVSNILYGWGPGLFSLPIFIIFAVILALCHQIKIIINRI